MMTADPVPPRMQAVCEVDFVDSDALDFAFQDNYVFFEDEGQWRLAPSFRVAFDEPLDEIDGQHVTLRLTLGDDDWVSEVSATVEIADRDGCMHDPVEGLVCE